jgi:exopolyphosphatase/guanosine-5'-triphosphate,3'-diphosphate pyrophosphatase
MWGRHHGEVPVAVIDVGSNTVRLLVARGGREILSRREMLRLGASVERLGRISDEKLAETADVVGRFAADARAAGATLVEILITSPGRQAENGDALVDSLARAGGCAARVLSAVEEGRLAFAGALAIASPPARRPVAVVDVGGGSAQVVVGTRRDGAAWARSIDLGSQRLTSRHRQTDPPGPAAGAAARAEVQRYLEGFDPPRARIALVVGGSARAIKRVTGPRLDAEDLADVVELVATTPAAELVERYGIDPPRVRTVAAGAVLLAEIQRRVGIPLKVVRGGVREGALLELVARRAAA